MDDLISRQAAIDAIITLWANKPFGNPALTEIKDCVERVPYAQPEIIRCWECKWFDISEPSGTVEPIGYICHRKYIFVESDDFCKRGERRENETSKR